MSQTILQPKFSGLRRSQLMAADSATVLKRFYFLERTLIRMEAGWLPGIEDWAGKLLIPEVVWQDAQMARSLRERILELRYPERRIRLDDDLAAIQFYSGFIDAPSDLAFLMALARVIKPHVQRLFQDYLGRTDRLDDAPSVYFFEHAIADLDRQITELRDVVDGYRARMPALVAEAERWCQDADAALRGLPPDLFWSDQPALGLVFASAAAGGKPFAISRSGVRDRRFHRVRFAWPDRHTPQWPGAGLQLQIRQAVHHLNEVWAAEMAAACIYDLTENSPPDFLDDAGRWCFDEIRHCRMGYERLKEWGFVESEMPLDSFSYDAGKPVGELARLGIIFFFETTYINTKPERMKIFGGEGDRLSSHDMDFDWADELIHTHYGKKWLTYFLSQGDPGQTLAQVKALAEQAVIELQKNATAQDIAETQAVFERVMSKARELLPG